MTQYRTRLATLAVLVALPAAAAASEACRGIAVDAERLACYDRAAAGAARQCATESGSGCQRLV